MGLALGTQTASLVNHLMSLETQGQPEPAVGMGATLLAWSDRYAATVTRVEGGLVTVQEDTAARSDLNGHSESQTYTYSANPNGTVHTFRQRHGSWEQVRRNERTGRWVLCEGLGLKLGVRAHYRDPSF